ncbi:MAG: hypothetical protein U1C96_10350 [Gallionella sp.]|nr:hypothetical protein [Gallionella sp.]
MNRTIFFLLLASLSSAAQAELEVVALKHRSAAEILPVIRPLLEKDAVASGMGYQLILRASPRHLRELKSALESIDVAPRRLMISVMQDVDSETVSRLTEFSGDVGLSREARVRVPGSGGSGGANVEIGQGRDRAGTHVVSTRSLEEGRKTQKLQVLEGNRARIRTGQSVPVAQRQIIQYAGGTQQVVDSTDFRDVSSGFYVLPRISGDRVTLEISARDEALLPDNSGATRIQQTSSTVSGLLGEWLSVGDIGQQTERDDNTVSSRSTSRSHEQRHMLIRVEEIPDVR